MSRGSEEADALCPKDRPIALGGGASITEIADPKDPSVRLMISAPIRGGELAKDGEVADGWRGRSEGQSERITTAYAVCVSG